MILVIRQSSISSYHGTAPLLSSVPPHPAVTPPPAQSLEIVDTQIADSSSSANSLILASGALSIRSSVLRDNDAANGIVYAPDATGTIEGTTVSGNQSGAAVWAGSGVTIENVTISGNSHPPLEPPSIPNPWAASGLVGCATVRNSTITGNTAATGHTYSDMAILTTGGGNTLTSCSDPVADGAPAVFENTILDGSCVLVDLLGPPTFPISHGGNLETSGDTCGFTDPTDQVAVSPAALALGPLADNGGPTETHALLPGSVARDAAVLANCPATDQRGAPRPEPGGTSCDAGSFELLPEPGVGSGLLASVALLGALARRQRRVLAG